MMKKKNIAALLFLTIIISQTAWALSLSPSELKIKNMQPSKNYQFILLLTSEEDGLRNFEIKSSESFAKVNPDKFMLSEGEKKSIRISVNFPDNLPETEDGNIIIQPYINNEPSKERMLIKYSNTEENTESASESANDTIKSNVPIYQKKEFILTTIYGLIIIVSTLIVLFILPDIKRTTRRIKERAIIKKEDKKAHKDKKSKKIKKIKIKSKDAKRLAELEKKIDSASENVSRLTTKIEVFVESADNWLKANTDGKYGLE